MKSGFEIVLPLQPMELREVSEKLKSMEQLSLNNGNGQSYGYIVYRKRLALRQGSVLSMRGRPRDLLQVKILECKHFPLEMILGLNLSIRLIFRFFMLIVIYLYTRSLT